MHNVERSIPAVLASGTLPSFQDAVDGAQPMIAARDLGLISAGLLLRPDARNTVEIIHAEGPRRYKANDVASALSQLSGRPVHAHVVPRAAWQNAFERMPTSLADLLIKANDAKNEAGLIDVEVGGGVRYGTTALIDALRPLMPTQ